MSDALSVGYLCDLANAIRDAVLPELGSAGGRTWSGAAASGDITFNIDELAEKAMSAFVARSPVPLACYSEDRGLVDHPEASWTLVVDPIDGTRSANAGLEACCVSVAAARGRDKPRLRDVELACVLEIKSGQGFAARAGKGVQIMLPSGKALPSSARPSGKRSVDRLRWCMELTGRPAGPVMEVLSELVDQSSLGGGVFLFNSACYSITRLVTGQTDAYVDIGAELLSARPSLEEAFRKAGRGNIIGIFPYDIAAVWLIAREAGCVMTDASGGSLGDAVLTESRQPLSCIAAVNADLHAFLIDYVSSRLQR